MRKLLPKKALQLHIKIQWTGTFKNNQLTYTEIFPQRLMRHPQCLIHIRINNPSTLDKYFRLDLGKKNLNILASKNHKRENSLNNLNRIELPKDPSLAEPIFDKSSPEKSDEVEWKKDQIVHKYKTKLAHEKLMKKTQQKAKINIKGKTDLKKNIYKEPDSPTLSTVHKNLIEEQKRLEEADTWNQQRRKRKKNPLIDLTEKLDKVLKEPFKKDKAWIRFNDHYKVANQYHG